LELILKIFKILLIIGLISAAIFSVHIYNTRFPFLYVNIINKYAAIYDVDPILIASIINVESGFNRNAVSPAGASGLMQIMPGTAYWAAEQIGIENFVYEEMIFDPNININMGVWYIRRLIDSHARLDVALAAYNAGSGNVANWLADPNLSLDGYTLYYIPFGETRRYVERVRLNMIVYRVRFFLW